ncbi:MAG: hypothetical protein AAF226_04875, partial [Verrucomicrobiota bacterium]
MNTKRLTLVALISGLAGSAFAQAPIFDDNLPIKPTLDSRARYEYGAKGAALDSHALTLRNRVGLKTDTINGFQAFAEYEGTNVADKSA